MILKDKQVSNTGVKRNTGTPINIIDKILLDITNGKDNTSLV